MSSPSDSPRRLSMLYARGHVHTRSTHTRPQLLEASLLDPIPLCFPPPFFSIKKSNVLTPREPWLQAGLDTGSRRMDQGPWGCWQRSYRLVGLSRAEDHVWALRAPPHLCATRVSQPDPPTPGQVQTSRKQGPWGQGEGHRGAEQTGVPRLKCPRPWAEAPKSRTLSGNHTE